MILSGGTYCTHCGRSCGCTATTGLVYIVASDFAVSGTTYETSWTISRNRWEETLSSLVVNLKVDVEPALHVRQHRRMNEPVRVDLPLHRFDPIAQPVEDAEMRVRYGALRIVSSMYSSRSFAVENRSATRTISRTFAAALSSVVVVAVV